MESLFSEEVILKFIEALDTATFMGGVAAIVFFLVPLLIVVVKYGVCGFVLVKIADKCKEAFSCYANKPVTKIVNDNDVIKVDDCFLSIQQGQGKRLLDGLKAFESYEGAFHELHVTKILDKLNA